MAERLTHWPLRAKVTVAVLSIVLAMVVGIGSARQGSDNEGFTAALPPSSTSSAPPASPTSTMVATAPESVPPSTAPTAPPFGPFTPPPPPATPTGESAGSASALLAELRIVDGAVSPPGYSRDLFPTWLDLDGNGCDAREDTLIAESVVTAEVNHSDGCDVVSGHWVSIYDGVEVREPSELDVDHLVPLAEAWRSGANGWDAARRAAFANDLTFADHLIAVTASTNRSKSDSPPNEWRPPRGETWCRYATAWVNVKATWSLSATTTERHALGQMLDTC